MSPISKGLIPLVDEDIVDPEDLIYILKGNFADNILKEVFLDDSLRNFLADLHENKIKKFKTLDNQLLKINIKRIQENISEKRPDMYSSSSKNSELGTLQNEFNRKRRHMPIRKLLNVAGGLIQTIKPCFLMSPLNRSII